MEKVCGNCKFLDFEEFEDGRVFWCTCHEKTDEDSNDELDWGTPACSHFEGE